MTAITDPDLKLLMGRLIEGLETVRNALAKLDEQVSILREIRSTHQTRIDGLEADLQDLRVSFLQLSAKREDLQLELQTLMSRMDKVMILLDAAAQERKDELQLQRYRRLAEDILKMLFAAGAALGVDRLSGG